MTPPAGGVSRNNRSVWRSIHVFTCSDRFGGRDEETSDADHLNPDATIVVNVLSCEPAKHAELLDLIRENAHHVIPTLDG